MKATGNFAAVKDVDPAVALSEHTSDSRRALRASGEPRSSRRVPHDARRTRPSSGRAKNATAPGSRIMVTSAALWNAAP